MRYSLGTLWAFVISAFIPFSAKGDLTLHFGTYSSETPSEIVKQFRPLLTELESRLSKLLQENVVILTNVAPDYESGIHAMVSGRFDLARFGPASYVKAKKREPRIDVIAMENEGGSKTFYGVICVKATSEILSISDLVGKSFAFGDVNSTIGRYLSQQLLVENGVRARDLKNYAYLGRHDLVGSAVATGDFDAGAIQEKVFEKLVNKGENLRPIARIPNVTKPWITRRDLPKPIVDALRKSLLDIPANSKALIALRIDGFFPGSDDDFASTRKAIDENTNFFE